MFQKKMQLPVFVSRVKGNMSIAVFCCPFPLDTKSRLEKKTLFLQIIIRHTVHKRFEAHIVQKQHSSFST